MSGNFTETDFITIHKFIEMIKENEYLVCSGYVLFYKQINDIRLTFPKITVHTNSRNFEFNITAALGFLERYKKNYPIPNIL